MGPALSPGPWDEDSKRVSPRPPWLGWFPSFLCPTGNASRGLGVQTQPGLAHAIMWDLLPTGVSLGWAPFPSTHHLHGVGEHHAIQADEVPMVQGVHGIHLPDEVVQCLRLAQHICLEALHCHIQLWPKQG